MITAADVMNAVDAETLSAGKVHAIPFQKIVDRCEVMKDSADFVLLGNILDVLCSTKKLKRINGNPPMYIKI